MNKEIILERLSLIKLLYKQGVEQSNFSTITASFSILSFHDSVEMFLKLAIQKEVDSGKIKRESNEYKKYMKSEDFNFMQHWEVIPELKLQAEMRQFNTRRVSFKHNGQKIEKSEIENSRTIITQFFEVNTPIIFKISFSEISLFELVKFQRAKEYLINAQDSLENNGIKRCVEQATVAFHVLLYEYKKNKEDWSGRTHFDLVKKIYPHPDTKFDKELKNAFETINKNFEALENTAEVLSLGFDYKKYSKFKTLTPICTRLQDGEYWLEKTVEKNWTKYNCQFLIDFTLECALKLQDFDFEHQSLIKDQVIGTIFDSQTDSSASIVATTSQE